MVDSPEYDCQFVLVRNDTAVFHAWSGLTPGNPSDSHRCCWRRWKAYRKITLTKENASTLRR